MRSLDTLKRCGAAVRFGVLLCSAWLVCTSAYHPWEPMVGVDGRPRAPGTVEALTRFFWTIGAHAEESVTDLFWTPPAPPILRVYRDRSELEMWIYNNYYEFGGPRGVLDYLGLLGTISKDELAVLRRNGYQDWEILDILENGSSPSVITDFKENRRHAFNPFRGLIASAVAILILLCIPLTLGWALKPLGLWHRSKT